jgi:hypothetical protein
MTSSATSAAPPGKPDRALALRIIQALRDGRNCLEGASSFSAGRTVLLRAATDLFDELDVSGGAVVRWIKGRTGQGKTHLFARLIDIAHARNWVTSYVLVSVREHGTELHRFEEIYAAIVRNCLCRDLVAESGRVEPGQVPGWDWILEDWWKRIRRQAVGHDGGDVPTLRVQEAIDQTVTAMRTRWSLHGSFAEALRQFALSRADGDEEWSQVLRAWFRGEDVHSRGGEVRARLLRLGIRESLRRQNAKEMLRSLSTFVRYRGFGGLLILLDELENVLQQPPRARRTSYTILRELIDNVDDRHGMMNTAFYISATPDVFDSERGLAEYEALAERVMLPGGRVANPAAPVIDLSAWPLSRAELHEMAGRIAALHGVAKGLDTDAGALGALDQMLDEQLHRNPDLTARTWVRTIIDEIDARFESTRT